MNGRCGRIADTIEGARNRASTHLEVFCDPFRVVSPPPPTGGIVVLRPPQPPAILWQPFRLRSEVSRGAGDHFDGRAFAEDMGEFLLENGIFTGQ